jgi:hypothetical protein
MRHSPNLYHQYRYFLLLFFKLQEISHTFYNAYKDNTLHYYIATTQTALISKSRRSEMEQAPERLALLEQPEGIVDVRERQLVRYEAIEIYLHLLKKKCKNIKLPFNQDNFGSFKGSNNDTVFSKENFPVLCYCTDYSNVNYIPHSCTCPRAQAARTCP